MAQGTHKIRWNKVDYMNLGRAIKNFNRTMRSLETDENQAFLPDYQDYKEMKESIQTRQELNRYIKSLWKFRKESEQEIITLESGQKITMWEYKQIQEASQRALRNINREIKQEFTPLDNGFSKAQMGSLEYVRLKEQKASIENWKTLTGAKFHQRIKTIQNLGRLDYKYRKALMFRENYINEMEKYAGYEHYDLLEEFFKKYQNPLSFYNRVKNNEILVDLRTQSEQTYSQEEFNRFLVLDVGIDIDEMNLTKNQKDELTKIIKEEKKQRRDEKKAQKEAEAQAQQNKKEK